MIIFLYGADTYRSQEKLNQLKEKFKREIDNSGRNIFVFDEDNLDLDRLKSALFTYSFLVKKKMVILKRVSKFKKEILEEISTWFKRLENNSNLILIFWEEDITPPKFFEKKFKWVSKNKKDDLSLIKQLQKIKYAYKFLLLSGQKLKQWIKNQVKKQNGKIDFRAIDLLTGYMGSNLWQMSQEINKLIAYKNEGIINKDDVELLTKAKIDENIFHLVDAVGEKNVKQALKLINQQIESGVNIEYLLIMLIRQFKILLQIKDFLQSKIKPFELTSQFKLHPFIVKKAIQQSQKYSLEELKKIYNQLLDIDLKSKTSQIDAQVLLDLFITKIYSI